jgi:hypothetical protein
VKVWQSDIVIVSIGRQSIVPENYRCFVSLVPAILGKTQSIEIEEQFSLGQRSRAGPVPFKTSICRPLINLPQTRQ